MAPNGHKAASRRSARQSEIISAPSWLKTHGKDEYQRWRVENPSQKLSYDDWKADGQHLHGLALFYATKSLLDDESSEDETDSIEAKSRPRVVRTQSAREPKKKVTTNGTKIPRAASSTTSSPLANSGSASPTGKRKRKAPRKYLSEEIIASDVDSEEDVDEKGPATIREEVATPVAPIITVNGHRKSSSRRPRKKPISEETISPEDEMDDPMLLDTIATPTITSPLPVRSAQKAAIATKSAPPPPPKKTHILKLSTRRTPKKAPDETATAGADKTTTSPAANSPITAAESGCKIESNGIETPSEKPGAGDDAASTAGSPDASSTRRGLRIRKPAQQRPYYHDAQLFDDDRPSDTGKANSSTQSPDIKSRRVSVASLGRFVDDELLEALDEETIALLLQEDDEGENNERRPKHFKGKGRAWKKEESDEDEEFSVAKKKKAAKAKAKGADAKKRGRPRKSALSEDIVHDTSDTDAADKASIEPKSPSSPRSASKESAKRKRAPPRKSALSAEFVQDSSDVEDVPKTENSTAPLIQPSDTATPPSKKKARAHESDHSTAATPAGPESPRASPRQSHTPIGTPRSPRFAALVAQDADAEDAKIDDQAAVSEAGVAAGATHIPHDAAPAPTAASVD
ncbi:hypothetical protein ACN47E_001538 [Coniothyrium glycines]